MLMTKKKKWVIITAIISTIVILAVTITCCVMLIDQKYDVDLDEVLKDENLIFADEFNSGALNKGIYLNGETVDRDVWRISDTSHRPDPVTGENVDTKIRRGAYWDMDQVSFRDGNMVITTEKKSDGNYYTAGLASSAPGGADADTGFYQKYGYFEIKAKLPKGHGIWSAFWMMSDNFSSNAPDIKDASKYGAEIDIFEAPTMNTGIIQQAVHKGGYGTNHGSIFNPKFLVQNHGDLHDTYNTYGLFWDENIYKFYVNRKCVWTTSYDNNVSKVPQWLFISIETGGDLPRLNPTTGKWEPTLGGNPWSFIGGKPITDNPNGWKTDFVIDYVKVWNTDFGNLDNTESE